MLSIVSIGGLFLMFVLGTILGSITMVYFLRPHVKRIALKYLYHYFESKQFVEDLKEFHVYEGDADKIKAIRCGRMDAILDRLIN